MCEFILYLYMTNNSVTFSKRHIFGFPSLTSSCSPWTPHAATGLTPLEKKTMSALSLHPLSSNQPWSSHQWQSSQQSQSFQYESPLLRGSLGLPKRNQYCQYYHHMNCRHINDNHLMNDNHLCCAAVLVCQGETTIVNIIIKLIVIISTHQFAR